MARDFAALARAAGIRPRPDADFDIATCRPLGPESPASAALPAPPTHTTAVEARAKES